MQKPFFKGLYGDAFKAYQQNQGQGGYTGNYFAGPNQTQLDANQGVVNAAGSLGSGGADLRQLAMDQIQGQYLDPNSNPWIKDVVAAGIKPLQQGLDRNLLNIDDRAISQGAYGGSRQDLQQLSALSDFNKVAGELSSNVYAQNYANERQIQQNSGSLINQADLMALIGPSTAASAGGQQQTWDQQALDNARAQFQGDQNAPWAGMQDFLKVLTAGGFGQATSVEQGGSNPLGSALQGAIGGASTGASVAMTVGGLAAGAGMAAFAPWIIPFALLGGLAGGLL